MFANLIDKNVATNGSVDALGKKMIKENCLRCFDVCRPEYQCVFLHVIEKLDFCYTFLTP